MNYDEMKKSGVDKVVISNSLAAPLMKISIKLNEQAVTQNTNDLIIYVDDKENATTHKKEVKFNLPKPLLHLGNISDEFVIDSMFQGNKVQMGAGIYRRVATQEELTPIEVGMDLSGKELQFNFPKILGTYANLINLFESEKYSVVELFEVATNRIVLKNKETNKIIETIYLQNGQDEAEINTNSFIMPNDFGSVTNIINIDSFSEPLQYIKAVKEVLVEIPPKYEKLPYQPIILTKGTNVISTNYTNALIQIIFPKESDLVRHFLLTSFTYDMNNEDKFLTLDDIYFKNCFTEVEDKLINALFNKLTIKCMNSTNNTFSLDCEGNLKVNSIITNVKEEPVKTLTFNDIYPVGSIYISVNSKNPSTMFGGTWTSFGAGRVLVGVDTSQSEFNTVNKTGGSKTVKLEVNHLPSHNHTGTTGTGKTSLLRHVANVGTENAHNHISGYSAGSYKDYSGTNFSGANHYHDFTTSSIGGNQAHSNIQPYITVYMWKRTK